MKNLTSLAENLVDEWSRQRGALYYANVSLLSLAHGGMRKC